MKQILLDIIIMVSIPVLLVGGYFMFFREESTPLLSARSEMLRTDANEPGNQTKLALQALERIVLNGGIFDDPAYLGLKVYTVEIPTADLARDYPFTPSDVVADMLRRAKVNTKTTASVQTPAKVSTSGSISQQLDLLKSR